MDIDRFLKLGISWLVVWSRAPRSFCSVSLPERRAVRYFVGLEEYTGIRLTRKVSLTMFEMSTAMKKKRGENSAISSCRCQEALLYLIALRSLHRLQKSSLTIMTLAAGLTRVYLGTLAVISVSLPPFSSLLTLLLSSTVTQRKVLPLSDPSGCPSQPLAACRLRSQQRYWVINAPTEHKDWTILLDRQSG